MSFTIRGILGVMPNSHVRLLVKNKGWIHAPKRKMKMRKIQIFLMCVVCFLLVALTVTVQKAKPQDKPASTILSNNKIAATVNGKAITMQEVHRDLTKFAQGKEAKLSPLELVAAQLHVLETLIEQEVMFQKAENEKTLPTDKEVALEFNKIKNKTGKSAKGFEEAMKDKGQTETAVRESLIKQLAVKKLIDKITGKIEPPENNEIEGYYRKNRDVFGSKLLQSPDVRQQISDALTNDHKNLVIQAYTDQAINEATIENLLAKTIVNNINELSGARPSATKVTNKNSQVSQKILEGMLPPQTRNSVPQNRRDAKVISNNEIAATVNRNAVTMQDVDRDVKQQARGQESELSPLELAGARLQVLDTLIQQEVMFQKAEKEGTVPTEEEITAEVNRQKTQSGLSVDQIEKEMKDQGLTEATLRDSVKKALAIQTLVEKVTGKIEPPKDSEIEAFYNGNKEAFVKRRGVKLAAIVIDPANGGVGDQTIDDASALSKANEIVNKLKAGQDFASLAREHSEHQSKFQGGDLGYLAAPDMKQAFPRQTVAALMNPQLQVGGIIITRSQGKLFILKLQERSDKDETLTLESPGVRQQVIESLGNSRKQLLAASYQAVAMNEAAIENYFAKKVVDNPNELSGSRPSSRN